MCCSSCDKVVICINKVACYSRGVRAIGVVVHYTGWHIVIVACSSWTISFKFSEPSLQYLLLSIKIYTDWTTKCHSKIWLFTDKEFKMIFTCSRENTPLLLPAKPYLTGPTISSSSRLQGVWSTSQLMSPSSPSSSSSSSLTSCLSSSASLISSSSFVAAQ